MKTFRLSKNLLFATIILAVISSIILGFVFGIRYIKSYSQKLDLQQEVALLEKEILEKSFIGIDNVLHVISLDKNIADYLTQKTIDSKIANAVIQSCNKLVNGSITYIMDSLGTVQLSTSFEDNGEKKTLLHKNYSFRPYFNKAMHGHKSIYPAVGVTTKKRGIYFSSPIYGNQHKLIGVVAIKMNTDIIQNLLDQQEKKILMVTPEGVVFISNEEKWLFGSTKETKHLSIEKLNNSQQFNHKIQSLPFKTSNGELMLDGDKYLLYSEIFNEQLWQIIIIAPIDFNAPINPELKKIIQVSSILIFMLLITISLLLYSNRTRQIAKLKISESRENLNVTLNSIGEAVIATNKSGEITRINPIACKLIGLKHKDCLGTAFSELITLRDEKTRRIIKDPLSKLRAEDKDYLSSKIRFLVSKDSTLVPVSETATAITRKDKSISGYVFVYRDISKIYDLKQELQENQFHLRKIIDGLPQSIAVVNEEGTLLLNNKKFEDLTGLNTKRLNSKKDTSLYKQSDYFERSKLVNQEVIKTGIKNTSSENEYTDINGKNYTFNTIKMPFNYYKHSAVLTVSSDISEIKHFQEKLETAYEEIVESNKSLAIMNKQLEVQYHELADAKAQLEISNKLKTSFLQNISHEIRTPLNGIVGFIDLILNDASDKKEKECHAQIIKTNSKKLLVAIEEVLEISKLEIGQVKLSSESIFPINFLEDIHQTYPELKQKKNIAFSTDFNHANPDTKLISDGYIIRKILDSLLSNAFKYTRQGKVTIGCQTTQGNVTFFISDTGIGIPKEQQAAIFDHFNQINDIIKLSTGLGLGLTIAKQYTELIKGSMWLESHLGKGSTFYLKIPILNE